mgnify:CR=1 FL=1
MNFFKSFTSIKLPEKNILISLLEEVLTVLSSENEVYRPKSEDGNLGGMLIFNDELPTILVPDLHARYNFLQKLLQMVATNIFMKKANGKVFFVAVPKLVEWNVFFRLHSLIPQCRCRRNEIFFLVTNNMRQATQIIES